ncbi:MAG TPA: type IV pilus assembly protein PilM [Candidatus Eisenbacteria bacterium]|nr:type IV pilus assembly protein PilM [Candidatus Eisenbacteria bacterium]
MFGKKKSTIGLDIGSSSIKVVEIARDRTGDRLVNYGISEPLSEAIVDGEIMDRQMVHEAITNLMEARQIKCKNVVTAVSGRAVIVKKILMDRLNEEDAKEAIQWEAEQHVPYDINDVSLDFQIINPNVDQKKMQVLLVAAKKDMVANHADIIREAGLQPSIIDVDSFAIQNAVEANYDLAPGETVALLNIGAEITNLNIVRDSIPHFTKDLSVGANSFVEGIQRRHNVSQADAMSALRGHNEGGIDVASIVQATCEDLSVQIDRAIAFLKSAGDADRVDRILVSGGSARVPSLADVLAARHQVPVAIVNPVQRLSYDPGLFGGDAPESVAPVLTVAVGLALR